MMNKVIGKTPTPENPVFSTYMKVRFNDVNLGNHLDYAALLEIVGNARAQFFKSHGCNELDIDGVGIIVKSLYVEYISEAKFDDLLEIHLYLANVKNSNFEMIFLVKNNYSGNDVAKISKKIAFFDYKQKRICAMPNKFISMIKRDEKVEE
ncbi:MAG: acyl-CoA thioesterase [Candidatus Berkiella sp.]